ncbi:tRNA(Ile)(2)-agmatinylcytidine synthase [Halorubrum ezzemoulense]|uniref:tRNA(Ile)(2)-agmatinylcytidine synthase n=1 Tax=Halorubrum ezzemoulense TaxID=337243 RepID=UPI00232EE329|nr:tRNA(Ile)(2)-agmatinylcytidine synthase [Halorubrum ezzemoulense]MDB9280410.1 tRNA(Ile)(2)-agmatinylcytidine synthase [Halorubrum ezzemoulense]MDB9283983.1 tRNA(Ile)(2)-agmatinylcytidine synthase [Halorubrum ezzemoulense]
MPIVAVDDTDSRERGMCTTYVATQIAERLADAGARVRRRLLVRLNPAVKHKTRGNAAVALHVTGTDAESAASVAAEAVEAFAAAADPRTSPGVVVADLDVAGDPFDPTGTPIPDAVAAFARRALRERLSVAEAVGLADEHRFRHVAVGSAGGAGESDAVAGRGRIGALAAVGAPAAFDDWTFERITYRELDRCGTPREVDAESVFAAADEGYPAVWDTVDRGTGKTVCVPNAPGPILYGIRGDDAAACRAVAAAVDGEPTERAATFLTNQGTDAHLAPSRIGDLRDGAGYRVAGAVASAPETKRGGHVHVDVASDAAGVESDGETDADRLRAVAFAPTGRFRDRVRALRPGDRVTLCGEHEVRDNADEPASTLKLEKFAVRDLVRTAPAVPTCPDCGRSMSSAGSDQGYRCRDCGTEAPGKVAEPIERDLEAGWYEVPPSARRHVAKPLVRGGFDAPTHPER